MQQPEHVLTCGMELLVHSLSPEVLQDIRLRAFLRGVHENFKWRVLKVWRKHAAPILLRLECVLHPLNCALLRILHGKKSTQTIHTSAVAGEDRGAAGRAGAVLAEAILCHKFNELYSL